MSVAGGLLAGGLSAGGLSGPTPRHAVIPAQAGISMCWLARDLGWQQGRRGGVEAMTDDVEGGAIATFKGTEK